MMVERRFQEDTIQIDATKIETYDHDTFGPVTVFKDVVIARAIVHKYDDGMAYKPGKELGEAYWTADGMWSTSGGHPSTAVISTRNDIHGRTVNVRFTKSLKDPKTKRGMDRGILADLEVFDNKISPETLGDMKSGKKSDVSIGFFFDHDAVAGVVDDKEDQSLKGTAYDYVQRNITINHVAFGLDNGRCGMPYCGIGADGVIREAAGDPFGEYKDFADCVSKNQDKDDPEAYCAAIERKIKEARKKKDFIPTDDYNLGMKKTIEEAKVYLKDVLSKLDSIEFIEDDPSKDDLVEEEYQGNVAHVTLSERAKMFHSISDDDWLALTEEEKEDYINKLPPEKPLEGETNKDEEDTSDEEESEDCDDCPEDEQDEGDEFIASESSEDTLIDAPPDPDEVLATYRRTVEDKDYPY